MTGHIATPNPAAHAAANPTPAVEPSGVIRMNIYVRDDEGESWRLAESPIAERNGEPISTPWDRDELLDTLDNYTAAADDGEWYCTLTDESCTVLVESFTIDRRPVLDH